MSKFIPNKNNIELFLQKTMKKNYKILIPNMLPIHFELFKNILIQENFNCEILNYKNNQIIETKK